MTITLTIPVPPSQNNLFANGKRGRYITPGYAKWRTQAGWEIITQKPDSVTGPYSVLVEIPAKTRGDVDNYSKGVLDLLVRHRITPDDKQAQSVTVTRAADLTHHARVTVEAA